MANLALDYFADNLPNRPYCTDELLYGLRIRDKEQAILARFIQHNPPHSMYWFGLDVDRVGAAIDWTDCNAPAPNITVKNQKNGHAHLLYALQTPVRTAPEASLKALKYAAAVERGLCEKLQADVNYSGLICKNPYNSHWQVTVWRDEPYTLDELADYVDLKTPDSRRTEVDYGLGRNCLLFEKTRKWSYKAIRQGFPDFDQWQRAVVQRVEMYNSQLATPLSLSECGHIGRSIAKWTHKRFTAHSFEQYVIDTHTPEIQATRGRVGGKNNKREVQAVKGRTGGIAKGEAYSEKREQARLLRVQGLSYQAIADVIEASRRSVINWCK
ncbi:plasmid replication protein [Salmonella enterica]|nr:plasmid replication protein [Salmonella enterica]